jgi:hypothetical protein
MLPLADENLPNRGCAYATLAITPSTSFGVVARSLTRREA